MTLSLVTRAVHALAGEGTGMRSVPQDRRAVDENVPDTGRELVRGGVGAVLPDRVRVEDDDVRLHAVSQQTPVSQSEAVGDRRAGLANGVFQRHPAQLTDVAPQNARIRAIRAGMDEAEWLRPFRVHAPGIGAEPHPLLLELELHVVLAHGE